jgi:hypothetical protein
MPTLFNTLLLSSSTWLDRLADMVGPSLDNGPPACRRAQGSQTQAGPQAHDVSPALAADDRRHLVQVRNRITVARAQLNPVRRLARMRSAPGDACRTVISGRIGEVCDLLDQLVAREAATMRRHAGTTSFR